MIEVYIARKRNKWGRRFGFVRFSEVTDEKKMEYALDIIKIGEEKLYVNLPRFKRLEKQIAQEELKRQSACESRREEKQRSQEV